MKYRTRQKNTNLYITIESSQVIICWRDKMLKAVFINRRTNFYLRRECSKKNPVKIPYETFPQCSKQVIASHSGTPEECINP